MPSGCVPADRDRLDRAGHFTGLMDAETVTMARSNQRFLWLLPGRHGQSAKASAHDIPDVLAAFRERASVGKAFRAVIALGARLIGSLNRQT